MKEVSNNDRGISIIGLGAMGTALAKTLIKTGVPVRVWNRSPGKIKALSDEGAVPTNTTEEAIAKSSVSIVCVSDYNAVREIIFPFKNSIKGKTVINLTNGTPEQARELARWVHAHSGEYLDGGIMAIPPMIGTREAVIFYSGSLVAFEKNKTLLESLGTAQYFEGDPGLASLYDLSLLIAMYGMFSGFLQAVALSSTGGVKATEFTTVVIPWLKAMTQTLPINAKQIDSGDYKQGVVSNLGMQTVAYQNLVDACKVAGISIELMLPLKAMFEQAVSNGHTEGDISALIENIRRPDFQAK